MGLFSNKDYNDEEVLKYTSDIYNIKDDYKNKDYYLKQLEQINQRMNFFKEKFNNGEVKRLSTYYIFLADLLFKKISILYILSVEFDVIKQNVEEYFETIHQLSKLDKLSYTYLINLLSLGYLYNIDIQKFEFIKSNMIDEKYIDAVLDILRNKIFYNKVSTTKDFYFKEKGYFGDEYDKDTKGLMNVINSDKSKEFINYLDNIKTKYYNRLLKEYERIGENRYTYIGSYDFKLTAIAKILEIDKELLKNSKFIAIDLI